MASVNLKTRPLATSVDDNSIVFGAKDGQADSTPEPFSIGTIWAHLVSKVNAIASGTATTAAAYTDTAVANEASARASADASLSAAIAGKEASGTAAGLIAAAIGTTVQAFSATLAALSGVATQAFGRGLLNLASAAALRTSIALPTATTAGRLARYSDTVGGQGETTALFETAAGNVGVGGTSPLGRLHCFGDFYTSQSTGGVLIGYAPGNTIQGKGANGAGNTDIFLNPFAGNVGIGSTVTPTAKLDVSGDAIRVRTARTPASATAAGNFGEFCWDANFLYVCVGTNTWKRAALSTW